MGAFYVSIIFLGILLVIGSLFFIAMDKVSGKDFFKEFDRKKEEMFNLIQDSEEMLQELNKMSDYVVTIISEKNQEYFEKVNMTSQESKPGHAVNIMAPSVPIPSMPVTGRPIPVLPVKAVEDIPGAAGAGTAASVTSVLQPSAAQATVFHPAVSQVTAAQPMVTQTETKKSPARIIAAEKSVTEEVTEESVIGKPAAAKAEHKVPGGKKAAELEEEPDKASPVKVAQPQKNAKREVNTQMADISERLKETTETNKSRLVLNGRRREVLQMIEQGLSNDEIADRLKIGKGEIGLIRGLSK
ncbi:hypothetical protein CLHUN_15540 [Ruminiclostridium hungatei]|uniref:Uncharacterized protein n=1 Tax=Ruminiclostridium hungatei TaxID=48256 RepID=A0A1V4SL34_RUMHU|nr:LuxR C-terminal-related transcriptional regulator [Ruminiclostridium hungatei]OPX44560.1 hypothetical protein CLHUN_15540 [Ruminiclostridium hungatei]